MAHGGRRAPDGRAVAPSGPGALSTRTDMGDVSPRVNDPGSSLQYGDKARIEAGVDVAPIAEATGTSAIPSTLPGATGGSPPPEFDLSMFGGPSQFPEEPITAGVRQVRSNPQALAFKVDVLRYLATQPYAGSEVQQLLEEAENELDEALAPPMPGPADPWLY